MSLVISFVLIAIFCVFVYIFAGIETGVISLDVNLLRVRAATPKGAAERLLLRFARQPERFLALTLISINMSMVAVASLSTNLCENIGPLAVSAGSVCVSLFLFLFCEVLPKVLFAARPMERSLQVLPIVEFFDGVLRLPVRIVSFLTRRLMEWLDLAGDRRKGKLSRDELLVLLSMGASSGVLRERPHRMARGIITLKETRVCEIMVPRMKMTALDVNLPLSQARSFARECGFSRIPVYEGSLEQIVGVVYFKDLFLKGEGAPSLEGSPVPGASALRDLVKPPIFVPETMSASELLGDLRRRNAQMAIVLDEYGALAGVVSLEDILEEVVGEIHDELDEGTLSWRWNDDGSLTVKADVGLNTLAMETGIDFTDREEVSTLNGLILLTLGRIPATGESLLIEDRRMEVLAADGRKVLSVKILPALGDPDH